MFDLAFPQERIPHNKCGWSNAKYRVCKLSTEKENLIRLMTNSAREILLLMRDRCFCQHSDSSIGMPRNLQELARIRELPLIDSLCWSRF